MPSHAKSGVDKQSSPSTMMLASRQTIRRTVEQSRSSESISSLLVDQIFNFWRIGGHPPINGLMVFALCDLGSPRCFIKPWTLAKRSRCQYVVQSFLFREQSHIDALFPETVASRQHVFPVE